MGTSAKRRNKLRTRSSGQFGRWTAAAVALVRAIDPHRGDAPRYILSTGEARPFFRLGAGVGGCTSPDMSDVLRPVIADGWHGRGFTCIVRPGLLRTFEAFVGAVLHEYAHHLVDGPVARQLVLRAGADIIPDIGQRWDRQLAELPARPLPRIVSASPSLELCQNHGAAFIRACLHISWRSRLLWPGGVPEIVRPCPPLADPLFYGELLGDEPQQRREDDLAEVLAGPAPGEFEAFAAEDMRRVKRLIASGARRPRFVHDAIPAPGGR